MRTFVLWITAIFAVGCQEYELKNPPGRDLPTDTTGGSLTVGDPTGDTDEATPDGPDEPETPREANDHADVVMVPTTLAVDVLWVIDNSGSMGDDQDSLALEFPTFIDYFEAAEGVDYHIGVISTDMEDATHQGRLREAQGVRWIDAATPDPYTVFAEMAQMGTEGSSEEAGRAPTYLALTDHLDGHNAGFIREEASLAVIVISDEDDMSTELYGVDVDTFVSFMRGFKADPTLVTYSTIVGPVPDGCATADPGLGYPEVQTALGGLFWSICDPDWATLLESLAANAIGARREFFLTEIPAVDTLEVEVVETDGASVTLTEEGVEFDYDPVRNSVTLITYVPGPLATVTVHYDVDFGALP